MEIPGGTGRDGIFLAKILDGTGRVFFFSRRDGAFFFFFRGGTGRLYYSIFSRRDWTGWLCFFSDGTGRLYFLFAPGRAFFSKALHERLKSQRDGTGGKLTVDPPFLFRRERGTGKI